MKIEDSLHNGPSPLYSQIKQLITSKIVSGDWKREEKIPSENNLVRDLGVSRMTVNRALRELTQEGVLTRVQGIGTFVAPQKQQSSVLDLKNIADEIRSRGHVHSCEVLCLEQRVADDHAAGIFDISPGDPVFHSLCLHREDGVPVQLENRLVNPLRSPRYLEQDFTKITPNEHLSGISPAREVEHVIEACMPDEEMQRLLEIKASEPCLRLYRTASSGGIIGTHAILDHPASRFQLVGRFNLPQGRC